MDLERLVHAFEARLLNLGRRLWRPDPLAGLHDRLDRVEADLCDRRARHAVCEAEREAAERRLGDNQTAAALLTCQVESCLRRGSPELAWRQALELDRLRAKIAEDQKALPRHEQAAWSLGFQIRQLEREHARLRDQLRARLEQSARA